MVKIYEDSHVFIEEALKSSDMRPDDAAREIQTNGRGANSVSDASMKCCSKIGGGLPPADWALVEEVRVLLRDELKRTENFYATYSRPHYDDLLDSDSPNTCWRYLLHCDLDVEAAFELAKLALAWREANRIDSMTARDMVKDFWLHTPLGFTGKTRSGHDIIYTIGKNFRKADSSVKQVIRDFVAFILFDWDRRHKHDLEQFEIVFDVSETGLRNMDLDFSYWLVSIRDFFPARARAIYFVGIPFLIRPVIRLIISWLPERFRRIVSCGSFDELVRTNVDDESIPEEIGGKSDNKWRLAPIESRWAHEHPGLETSAVLEKIRKACDFNTSQERLDMLYKMQMDHERNCRSQVRTEELKTGPGGGVS